MRVGILCSNYIKIGRSTQKGSEVFAYILAKNLLKHSAASSFDFSIFCSGNSHPPVKKISFTDFDLVEKNYFQNNYHINFELFHISQALQMQDEFDLFHVNISNGEMVLPFTPFIRKPIIITMHGTAELEQNRKFFSLIKPQSNVHFVSISDSQRRGVEYLPFIKTIYHGVENRHDFTFSPHGGEYIFWAGRSSPEKGLDLVLQVTRRARKETHMCIRVVKENSVWLQEKVLSKANHKAGKGSVKIEFDVDRADLVKKYQNGKLFLFPILWREPFGFVIIESLSCGTPVVAFARGSAMELVKDGKTGFLVNPGDSNIKGEFIVKKTGVDGLVEAVGRIYNMPREEYLEMRKRCREDAVERFSVARMVDEYIDLYKKLK